MKILLIIIAIIVGSLFILPPIIYLLETFLGWIDDNF